MKKSFIIAGITVGMLALSACDDNTGSLGTSLNPIADSLKVQTDTFTVQTRSIEVDSVLSRGTNGYIGCIKDPETGGYITGDIMLQFKPLEGDGFPEMARIESYDENGEQCADSCVMVLYFNEYEGDTLNLMRMTAYEMETPLEENVNYYSNFDPYERGMVRVGGIERDKDYTLGNQQDSDSLKATTTSGQKRLGQIKISLNEPYTDKNCTTYNNYGTYLMRNYWNHPEYYKNSYNFIHNLCPGFYFKHKSGIGSITYILRAAIYSYFKFTNSENPDSIMAGIQKFSSTDEVLQTTNISNDESTISRLMADQTCTYLKTPAGIFTELTLPVEEIASGHSTDSISSARVVLTRVNNSKQDDYNLDVPDYLLCVEKDSLYTFFEQNKLPDNKSAYLTTYDKSLNTYTFSNLSSIITRMRNAKELGEKQNSQWTSLHPDWNKVVVMPVSVTKTTTSTSTTITKVEHNMSLTSTRLVGGTDNSRDPVKISIIYQKFND